MGNCRNDDSIDNFTENECFWDEKKSSLSHDILIKKWRTELKLDTNWKKGKKLKDTSEIYANESKIETDDYRTKYLNSKCYQHPSYNLQRRAIQHDIIDIFVNTPKRSLKPLIIFIGGASCIGKSFMISQLLQYNMIPEMKRECCVISNHDLIRPLLPEWVLYFDDEDKTEMYNLLYTEVVYCFQMIMWRGLKQGKNVLVDGTMKNYFVYQRFMEIIKTDYTKYKVGVIFIEPKEFDVEIIKERMIKRRKETGRHTPFQIIKDSYQKSMKSYQKLNEEYKIDIAMRIINLGEKHDVHDTNIVFDSIGLKCKLKHLIKWNRNRQQNESLLDLINRPSFTEKIDEYMKEEQ